MLPLFSAMLKKPHNQTSPSHILWQSKATILPKKLRPNPPLWNSTIMSFQRQICNSAHYWWMLAQKFCSWAVKLICGTFGQNGSIEQYPGVPTVQCSYVCLTIVIIPFQPCKWRHASKRGDVKLVTPWRSHVQLQMRKRLTCPSVQTSSKPFRGSCSQSTPCT